MACGAWTSAWANEPQRVHVGHLIDVRAERVLQDQVIEIRDGRIHALSVTMTRERDAGSATLDWSRYTVTPGLIDLHTHLIGDIQSANLAAPLLSSASRDTLLGVKERARDAVCRIHDRA
jgi:imidazolonepropionase-like amidohydrolase